MALFAFLWRFPLDPPEGYPPASARASRACLAAAVLPQLLWLALSLLCGP